MYCWAGTILHVDLTRGKVVKKPLDESFARAFIGGRGFNSKLLYDNFDPSIKDPYSPENIICIGAGLFSGTSCPSSSRLEISLGLSPVTNAFCDGNAGGTFAPELKFAGYDCIMVLGRSERPVYLYMYDDEVELREATQFWGLDVWEATDVIRDEIGEPDAAVLTIGPAGENLVTSACTLTNYTRAATGGSGAVFGSKKLKAIAVKGTKSVKVADPDGFEKTVDEIIAALKRSPFYENLSTYGTPLLVGIFSLMGALPSYNWQTGVFKYAKEIDGETLLEKYVIKHKGCFACQINCSRFYVVKEGPFAGVAGEGPEYEELGGFGSKCGISSLPALLYINNLLNQLGLDVVQTSTYVSCLMQWWQDGILNEKDTEGLVLEWGNYDAVIELLKRLAYRKGEFANMLADGILSFAEKLAAKKSLPPEKLKYDIIHTKGMMHSNVEVRHMKAMALSYGTSTRGGDHLRGHATQERYVLLGLYKKPEDWTKVGVPLEVAKTWYERGAFNFKSYEGKALLCIYNENLFAAVDSLGICKFTTHWINMAFGPELMAKLMTLATGFQYDWKELLRCGERIYNVERAMQVRFGMRREHDYLPQKLYEKPLPEGPHKGAVVSREGYDKMLDEYYEERGWDKKTGIPTAKKLKDLGLEDIANDLIRRRILSEIT